MAWQRKYRPRTVSELHLKEVREMLEQMMAQGRFPQVLLFAGPKGTGKTSASRIVGNLLNDPGNADLVDYLFFGKPAPKSRKFQEPDTHSDFANRVYAGNSFVVQEMDAASYRGIDDVRALKERVMLPPQEGKIAVYILDEAHMFTAEAFNALLKLLEEPPPHAVFILATTELHKIPDTIVSRSTKIDFRKATQEEMVAALGFVAKKEKLKYDKEALARVAELADGSFRDGVKLLELAAQSGELSLSAVESALGESVQLAVAGLIEAVVAKDSEAVSKQIAGLRERSVHETYFYKRLFSALHDALLQNLGAGAGKPIVSEKVARFLLQELLKGNLQQASPIPFLPLELKLLEIIDRAHQQNTPPVSAKKKIEKPMTEPVITPPVVKVEFSALETPLAEVLATPVIDGDLQQLGQTLIDQWEKFLGVVGQRNASLAALLRSSKPGVNADGAPSVGVYYKFHQEQLQQQKYMALIADCAKDVIGVSLPIQVSLEQLPQDAPLVEVAATQSLAELAEETLLDNPKV